MKASALNLESLPPPVAGTEVRFPFLPPPEFVQPAELEWKRARGGRIYLPQYQILTNLPKEAFRSPSPDLDPGNHENGINAAIFDELPDGTYKIWRPGVLHQYEVATHEDRRYIDYSVKHQPDDRKAAKYFRTRKRAQELLWKYGDNRFELDFNIYGPIDRALLHEFGLAHVAGQNRPLFPTVKTFSELARLNGDLFQGSLSPSASAEEFVMTSSNGKYIYSTGDLGMFKHDLFHARAILLGGAALLNLYQPAAEKAIRSKDEQYIERVGTSVDKSTAMIESYLRDIGYLDFPTAMTALDSAELDYQYLQDYSGLEPRVGAMSQAIVGGLERLIKKGLLPDDIKSFTSRLKQIYEPVNRAEFHELEIQRGSAYSYEVRSRKILALANLA